MTTMYELIIRFKGFDEASQRHTKDSVCAWLRRRGRNDFVEGIVDGVTKTLSEREHRESIVDDHRMASAPIALYDRDRLVLDKVIETLTRKFVGSLECSIHCLPDVAWNDCWREQFLPWCSRRFLIVPENHGPTTFDHLSLPRIEIDARGGAFGTGQHITTRCLMTIMETQWSQWRPRSILDVGTGTGILSIVAAKLGASIIHGTEIDRTLVNLAKENVLRNRVTATVRETADPWDGLSTFDLVIANILVPVLHDLMPSLQKCTKTGGRLLISGFIEKESAPIRERARQYGFVEELVTEEAGWTGMVLMRRH